MEPTPIAGSIPMGRTKMTALFLFSLACLPTVAAAQQPRGEAPGLAELSKAGKIPAVSERVGSEPEVIKPLQSTGKYGGEIRFGLRGSSDQNSILRMVGSQGLVRWNAEYTKIGPAVAKSFEVDPTATTYTFHLRKGMKWSDGQPFGADDILFSLEDIVLNKDFGSTPSRYMSASKPMKVEKLDDATVRFTFDTPNGDFLAELAAPLGQHPVLYAKHYCSQFHPKYNKDIDNLVKKMGASDWKNLLLQKCGDIETATRWGNLERPTLDPWVVKEPYVGAATRVVLERNPYFWQIDTDGNQLPYVDRLSASISQDVESLILSAVGGRIDFGLRHLDSAADRPVIAQNREKGDYRMFEAEVSGFNTMMIDLNLTHKDPVLRELFNTKDFRVALSLGIDRKEVIDTALLGEGEPWQQGPFENDSPYYDEKLSTQNIAFDPSKANELLDRVGLSKRGPDGMRLRPDGKPFFFQIDVIPTFQPQWTDMLNIIRMQWRKIGIDMRVNPLERTFFYERTSNSNDHDAAVWVGGAAWTPASLPHQLIPVSPESRWGIGWYQWYQSKGARGVEPPASVKTRFELFDQVRSTADPEKRMALVRKAIEIAAKEFEVFGVSKALSTYGIVKNNLRNVPEKMQNWWALATPAQTLPQTWYWSK